MIVNEKTHGQRPGETTEIKKTKPPHTKHSKTIEKTKKNQQKQSCQQLSYFAIILVTILYYRVILLCSGWNS